MAARAYQPSESGTGWEKELLEAITNLPDDPGQALTELLHLGARITGADTLLFQRVRGELVMTEASWGAPADLEPVDLAQGYLCVHVLRREGTGPVLLDSQELASYSDTDPALKSGDYLLCLAQKVESTGGALLLLYREGSLPGRREEEALRFLSAAVSREWVRKRLAERAREFDDKLSALLNAISEGVIIADKEGRIVFWNRGAKEIFGYSPEEALGQPVLLLVPEERRETCRRELLNGKNAGEIDLVGKVFEAMGRRLDGTSFPMEVSVTTWRTGRGKYYGIVIRDVTWRKSMEEDLRRSVRELGEFADTVAHDLRNPLTLMGGYAQTALGSLEEGDRETLRACLEGIGKAARRGLDYLESLLSFARAERGVPALRPVDPRAVLSEVMEELGHIIRSTGATVRVYEPIPVVMADPVHLHQILVNLMDNALKHGRPKSGTPLIEVGAEVTGDEVAIYVQDNGPGIPQDMKEEVFVPFRRLSESGEPGLGLGLSTARRLVLLAGGRIWVETNPSGGSVFRFTLRPAPSDSLSRQPSGRDSEAKAH